MRSLTLISLVGLLGCHHPAPDTSLDRAGVLMIEVMDASTKAPLRNADLSVQPDSVAGWDSPGGRTRTDSSGLGTLGLREPGSYSLRVRAFGYDNNIQVVHVRAGEITRVRVHLELYRNCLPVQVNGTSICM